MWSRGFVESMLWDPWRDTVYKTVPRRNVGLLVACQAMLFANNSTLIAINGLAGLALAPYAGLATLPVTCWVLGGAIATMPASLHMKRVGRQRGLTLRHVLGRRRRADLRHGDLACRASGCCAWARWCGASTTPTASTTASPPRTSRRRTSRRTRSRWSSPAAWSAASSARRLSRCTIDLVQPQVHGRATSRSSSSRSLTVLLLRFMRIPTPTAAERAASGRPLAEIAAQPKFIVAVLSGAIGYGVMNFLMTSTPIAMQACGHPFGDAAFVISSHIVGMFAPSFFTGSADPALRRAAGHADRRGCSTWSAIGDRARGHRGRAFLVVAGAARRRLELPLHRRHHAPHRDLPARGTRQGAGRQRPGDLHHDGDLLVHLRA